VRALDASILLPKERYAVSKDNIIKLTQLGTVGDQLTEILRNGVRVLLAQAVEADFLGKHVDLKSVDGHQGVVRHGHDHDANGADPHPVLSVDLPYMRRSKFIETPLPISYLKGKSRASPGPVGIIFS
jgi:hypothetical protein